MTESEGALAIAKSGEELIRNKDDLSRYLEDDLAANKVKVWGFFSKFKYPILHWQRHLRKLEYVVNVYNNRYMLPYVIFRRYIFRLHSIRLGFYIPPNVFGPGLSVPHWGTIVVNSNARVGSNCRIHPGTCLGEKNGKSPVIGDNCYIGPGAKIFGSVTLGDDVKIGANAVVNKSFGSQISLVGIPASPARIVEYP